MPGSLGEWKGQSFGSRWAFSTHLPAHLHHHCCSSEPINVASSSVPAQLWAPDPGGWRWDSWTGSGSWNLSAKLDYKFLSVPFPLCHPLPPTTGSIWLDPVHLLQSRFPHTPSQPCQLPLHHPSEPLTSDITVHHKWLQGATAIRINGKVSRNFPTESISLTRFLIQSW